MKNDYLILGIETSTLSCSVALFNQNEVLYEQQVCEEQHVHASRLLPMIDEAMKASNCSASDLSAVAVCAGPGSYTGLRIGVSTAKGICQAQSIPLIGVNSLEIQAYGASNAIEKTIIAVMDARRNEIYTQSFRWNGASLESLNETRAVILSPDSTASPFPHAGAEVAVIGDAASKTQRLLGTAGHGWEFMEAHPLAKDLRIPAFAAFEQKQFDDVAYFTPRYLKEFQAGQPKDPLGLRKPAIG